MTDIIVKIMVEVLNILGIATKEIKQGRTSELPIRLLRIGSTDRCSEKYLKKLLGKMEIEDSLKRLDKLTQEEVRMAAARLLKITDEVDDKVTTIDNEVKGIGGKVNDIGDTVRVVHDGTRSVYFPTHSFVIVYAARWKRNKSNRTTDGKRGDCNYAIYGKQRQRSDEFVVWRS
jgi:hypothetical protein